MLHVVLVLYPRRINARARSVYLEVLTAKKRAGLRYDILYMDWRLFSFCSDIAAG